MTPVRTASTLARAEEWGLVLEAEGLSPDIRHIGDEYVILVPRDNAHRAVHALWAYESENRTEPAPFENSWSGRGSLYTALAFAGAILFFFFVSTLTEPTFEWYDRGSASAERIVHGEFWRIVTSLTLHADFAHAASNTIAAVCFLSVAGTVLGPGLGLALILASGAAGNLLNALLHGYPHVSVGASTAIFGAVGVLGGVGFARRRRGLQARRAWVPLAAGVALLAMIGTGGQRVDLGAHLLGLLTGAAAGIFVATYLDRPVDRSLQWKLGIATIAVILVCWMIALA